jgi:2-C-methyl-D-erythritol 4-phosphate cytidylyltransferase/2-C-methyl-D-erythritol 2,4-cyclodiphosphate synthase
VDTFLSHPRVDSVLLVAGASRIDELAAIVPEGVRVVAGGESRRQSAWNALEACPDGTEMVLFHDAARPFVDADTVDRVLDAIPEATAAGAALPVTDTIREAGTPMRTLDRSALWAMQTPQGGYYDVLRQSHLVAMGDATDDLAQVIDMGVRPEIVAGDPMNFKITNASDWLRAQSLIAASEVRTGLGYDIHRFSPDKDRALWLGGVRFEGPGLEGHSDADVVLHAVVDAVLGAAALDDIGQHFPNTDPRWKDAASQTFLKHAARLVSEQRWHVVNVDVAVQAERPKIMGRAGDMRAAIAAMIGTTTDAVSIKATTNEGLGAIGRGEGIAAFAVATLRRLPR